MSHLTRFPFSQASFRTCSFKHFKEAKAQIHVPICAIGGINTQNIIEVSQYKIAMYSVISAVYQDDAIEENIKNLQTLI